MAGELEEAGRVLSARGVLWWAVLSGHTVGGGVFRRVFFGRSGWGGRILRCSAKSVRRGSRAASSGSVKRRTPLLSVISRWHRLANVRLADRIVVLEGGRIVEQGDFASLLAAGGLFAELYALQQDDVVLSPTTERVSS